MKNQLLAISILLASVILPAGCAARPELPPEPSGEPVAVNAPEAPLVLPPAGVRQ